MYARDSKITGAGYRVGCQRRDVVGARIDEWIRCLTLLPGTLRAVGYADLDTDLHGTAELVVGDADTASAQGSGDVPVLATPRLVALFEEAAVAALAGRLPEDLTSVGASIEVDHLAPSAVGSTVSVTALLEAVDGPALEFVLEATDDDTVVATGSHTRVLVEREQFLASARR